MEGVPMMTLEGLVKVVANGGGVILDGSKFMSEGLIQIAANAAGKGSHVVIRNLAGFNLDDLVRIAANGKGAVIFDLFDE
jgi:hypothetical protein